MCSPILVDLACYLLMNKMKWPPSCLVVRPDLQWRSCCAHIDSMEAWPPATSCCLFTVKASVNPVRALSMDFCCHKDHCWSLFLLTTSENSICPWFWVYVFSLVWGLHILFSSQGICVLLLFQLHHPCVYDIIVGSGGGAGRVSLYDLWLSLGLNQGCVLGLCWILPIV